MLSLLFLIAVLDIVVAQNCTWITAQWGLGSPIAEGCLTFYNGGTQLSMMHTCSNPGAPAFLGTSCSGTSIGGPPKRRGSQNCPSVNASVCKVPVTQYLNSDCTGPIIFRAPYSPGICFASRKRWCDAANNVSVVERYSDAGCVNRTQYEVMVHERCFLNALSLKASSCVGGMQPPTKPNITTGNWIQTRFYDQPACKAGTYSGEKIRRSGQCSEWNVKEYCESSGSQVKDIVHNDPSCSIPTSVQVFNTSQCSSYFQGSSTRSCTSGSPAPPVNLGSLISSGIFYNDKNCTAASGYFTRRNGLCERNVPQSLESTCDGSGNVVVSWYQSQQTCTATNLVRTDTFPLNTCRKMGSRYVKMTSCTPAVCQRLDSPVGVVTPNQCNVRTNLLSGVASGVMVSCNATHKTVQTYARASCSGSPTTQVKSLSSSDKCGSFDSKCEAVLEVYNFNATSTCSPASLRARYASVPGVCFDGKMMTCSSSGLSLFIYSDSTCTGNPVSEVVVKQSGCSSAGRMDYKYVACTSASVTPIPTSPASITMSYYAGSNCPTNTLRMTKKVQSSACVNGVKMNCLASTIEAVEYEYPNCTGSVAQIRSLSRSCLNRVQGSVNVACNSSSGTSQSPPKFSGGIELYSDDTCNKSSVMNITFGVGVCSASGSMYTCSGNANGLKQKSNCKSANSVSQNLVVGACTKISGFYGKVSSCNGPTSSPTKNPTQAPLAANATRGPTTASRPTASSGACANALAFAVVALAVHCAM